MSIWAVIVAAGSSSRFGAQKQVAVFGGKRVIDHSIDAFREICDGVVIVGALQEIGSAEDLSVEFVVSGGNTRSQSVRKGLEVLPEDASQVLIHDGARPLASSALVKRVVSATLAGADAVVPVIPVSDTLRKVDGAPVERANYVAVQTPQGFHRKVLLAAYETAAEATDDAALVDAVGGKVIHVKGESSNMKITFPHDILIAEVLFNERS